MKYRWEMQSVHSDATVRDLGQALNDLPEALARSLVVRGIRTFEQARTFFRPSVDQLCDPFLMEDMDRAADRLAVAIQRKESIMIYGDYDVDGVASVALMVQFIRDLGGEADYFIPHRTRDGYGLVTGGIDHAVQSGASLIVALDCGITAIEPAAYAREKGLDLIICDHHTSADTLPDAVAVLDPKRPDCQYPYDGLSGCGVGFKLAQATLSRIGGPDARLLDLLDFVAIAIASDIVPIDGENRVLMHEGLQRIRSAPRVGVRALASVAGLDLTECSTSQIVFGLAPRINAAGRLEEASLAVRLLLESDHSSAAGIARRLEEINTERRTIDQATLEEAAAMARRMMDARMRHGIVLHQDEWHPGVIGITASRIVERFHRPTVMLTTDDGAAKGSARSIDGINVYDALAQCADLLIQFGGHDYAAGLRLQENRVDEFRRRFEEAVEQQMTPDLLLPSIKIDAPVALGDIDPRFWAVLKQFAPFGPHNRTPVFRTGGLQVLGRPRSVGRTNDHLKFAVRAVGSDGPVLPAIGYGMGDRLGMLETSQREGKPVEMAFSLQENSWRGRRDLQIRPRDFRLENQAREELVQDSRR